MSDTQQELRLTRERPGALPIAHIRRAIKLPETMIGRSGPTFPTVYTELIVRPSGFARLDGRNRASYESGASNFPGFCQI